MQTSTHSPTRATTARRAVRSKPAVYPRLPDTDRPGFWLAVFLIGMAELDELNKISQAKGYWLKSDAFQGAIHTTKRLMREDLKVATGYMVEDGMLLFAHAHTTYFAQEGSAA